MPESPNANRRIDEPSPWEGDDELSVKEPRHGRSPARAIAISVILALIVLIVGVGYYVISKPKNVDIGLEFTKPNQVFLGQPFQLTVNFANYSDAILEGTKLSLTLPDGVSFVGQQADQRVMEQSTGDLGPGSVNQQTFNLIVLGGAQSLKHLDAKLIYQIPSRSSGQFESGSSVDVAVGQPAVSLALTTPDKVLNGEPFAVTVNYQNNGDQDLTNIKLHLDYPAVFQFASASVKPDAAANTDWTIPSLARGTSGSFTVRGTIVGPEQSIVSINGTVSGSSGQFLGQTYTLATQSANVLISTAPLSLRIQLQNTDGYVPHIGERLHYTLYYKNNSSVPLENATVSATFIGELFDFSSVRTSGSFNSITNTASWNAANTPDLASIAPGEEGSVGLDMQLLAAFPIRRLSDKNYALKVNGQIESPTVPPGTTVSKTLSLGAIQNQVGGMLKLAAAGYFRDAASGILNSGPYPPKVNQPTQYTIHWRLTNYATDISNVTVSASLQSGTTFTGTVKSTIESVPTVNTASGQVTWQISNLAATKGIVGGPVEAIFQVQLTPPVNEVGNRVTLIGPATVQATDTYVNQSLTDTAPEITTDLPDDPTVVGTDTRVQP